MSKKTYMKPIAQIFAVESSSILAASGGGSGKIIEGVPGTSSFDAGTSDKGDDVYDGPVF